MEIGDIVSITIEEVSNAGRPIKVKFTGTKGQITYYREDTRRVLELPSNNYTIISGTGSTSGTGTSSGSSGSGTVYAINGDGSIQAVSLPGSVAVMSSGTEVIGGSGTVYAAGTSGVSVISGASSTSTAGPVQVSGNVYTFVGKGWGHGVGMSQEGAKGFTHMGYTYDQILKHYFTGVTVE